MNRSNFFHHAAKVFFGVATLIFAYILMIPMQVHAFPGIITYQGKLTNASGATVSDGNYSIKFTLYDATTGGNCKYTASGTCGTPTALTVAVTSGIFSVAFGGSSTNTLDPTIFQTGELYLGVTVSSDSEMTPRKQMTNAPFAYNALYLSGLATSTIGGTGSYIPAATTNGNFTFTGAPQGTGVSQGVLYLNPASATSNYTLLGVAIGGTSKFSVDADGDISAAGIVVSKDVTPITEDIYDLGSSTARWGTIWGGFLRSTSNGYISLPTSGNVGISSSTPGRALDVAGGFMVSGSSILGDSSSDTLTVHATSTFNAGISSQDILPLASNTYDIGSASTLFRNVYATGTINVTTLNVTGTCTGCSTVTASGFSDGGTLVSLTTTNDQVAIGTSTAAAGVKLHIVQHTNDVSLRISAASGQTRNLTEWVDAASSSILAGVNASGVIYSSSSLQAPYGRFYSDVALDPNGATNYWVPLLLVGASSAPDDATVFIKRAVQESNGRGQIMLSESTVARHMGIGISDAQFGDGGSDGEAYISTWYSSIAARVDFGLYAGHTRLNAIPDYNGGSTTAAVTINYNSNSTLMDQPATLILQKEAVDRLRIYTTSSQRVVFTANVSNDVGTSAFVFNTATTLTSTTNRALFSVMNEKTRRFSIDPGGNVQASGAFMANTADGGFPGDLAEYVPITPGQSIEAGDVIVMDPANPIKHIKSSGALQKSVAGVVSNTGAFVIGSSDSGRRVPLALAGLVYVKATDEAGAIVSGDLLVTAPTPGHVMKYNPNVQTGDFSIVGMAMEPLETGENKKILAHVRNLQSTLAGSSKVSETSTGQLSLTSESLSVISISGKNNSWSISREGLLVSSEIETKSLGITDNGNGESTIGEGYFGPGEYVIHVLSNKVTKYSKIFVSFRSDLKGRSYYISSVTPGESFMVSLSSATDDPLVFDWWVVEKKVHDGVEITPEIVEEIPVVEIPGVEEAPVESTSSTENVVVEDDSTEPVEQNEEVEENPIPEETVIEPIVNVPEPVPEVVPEPVVSNPEPVVEEASVPDENPVVLPSETPAP